MNVYIKSTRRFGTFRAVAAAIVAIYLVLLYGVYVPDWEFVSAADSTVFQVSTTRKQYVSIGLICKLDPVKARIRNLYSSPFIN